MTFKGDATQRFKPECLSIFVINNVLDSDVWFLTSPRFLWFLLGFLTETVSPHSINVIVRSGGAPRFLVFIIHALKVLCTVVNKRKHATRAVARSPFCFYTARIQTWNRTVLYDSECL